MKSITSPVFSTTGTGGMLVKYQHIFNLGIRLSQLHALAVVTPIQVGKEPWWRQDVAVKNKTIAGNVYPAFST
jgi:hypothetical protein